MVEEYRDRVRINRYYVFFLFFSSFFYRLCLDNIPILRPAPFPVHFSYNAHFREFYFLRVNFRTYVPFEKRKLILLAKAKLSAAHTRPSSRSVKLTRRKTHSSSIVVKKCTDSVRFLASNSHSHVAFLTHRPPRAHFPHEAQFPLVSSPFFSFS